MTEGSCELSSDVTSVMNGFWSVATVGTNSPRGYNLVPLSVASPQFPSTLADLADVSLPGLGAISFVELATY